jgi:hypothetical protein
MIKSRSMGWVGHVASIGALRSQYKILFGKLKGRDNLENLTVDDNIKPDLKEILNDVVYWIHLAQDMDQ